LEYYDTHIKGGGEGVAFYGHFSLSPPQECEKVQVTKKKVSSYVHKCEKPQVQKCFFFNNLHNSKKAPHEKTISYLHKCEKAPGEKNGLKTPPP